MARRKNTTTTPETTSTTEETNDTSQTQETPEETPETTGTETPEETKSDGKKSKPAPPTLDQMAESPLCKPLVDRIRELQAEDEKAAESDKGDGDLASKRDAAHTVMTAAANAAIDAITEYRDNIATAENGTAAKLTGRVSRWSQGKGDPSTLDTFAKAAANYRKARKAWADSQGGTTKTPNGKEIKSLTDACRKVYATVTA